MTVEEIINKHWDDPANLLDSVPKMMEEYAKHQVTEFIKWYFLEAPKMEVENFDEGLLFVDNDNDKITTEQLYELFIQSKSK